MILAREGKVRNIQKASLYIDNLMKQQNNRSGNEGNNYRQSVSLLASQLIRHSFSGDAQVPAVYRQSVGSPYRTRNSLNLEMAEQLLRGLQHQKREKDKQQYNNLKSTLSDLQKKISKAKKKLNTFTSIISEDSEEEAEQQPKTPTKNEDITTIGSFSKLAPSHNSMVFSHIKIKNYYLSHIIPALEGKDKRALDHLNISLKVLRNYYKIQSPTFADLEQRKVNLPRDKSDAGKKTLLIDIDETILHCEQDPSKPYDLVLPIEIQNGSIAQAYITIRPYAISFLKRMAKHYEIIAFTASHESYADVVLDEIDPQHEFIKHRLYRRNCIEIHENIYAKDLRIVNRDLSSMVLIDNAPYSYIFQLQNGIPILPFYNGEDNELVQLQKCLQQMVKWQDVREFNKSRFKLHKYCNFNELDHMLRELYISQHINK